MREISRFGHAAKVWLVIAVVAMCFVAVFTLPSWRDFLATELLFAALFGAQLWFNTSERVWYDTDKVCARIIGKGRECISFSDIVSVSASHSWKRAAAQRPISELQITAYDGRQILISLRHLSLPGLQQMVDEIHRRTGVAVPELRHSVK